MKELVEEYGLFIISTLVAATIWLIISMLTDWGGGNTHLYATSIAENSNYNIQAVREPRFTNFYTSDSNGKNIENLNNVLGYKGSSSGYKIYNAPAGTVYAANALVLTSGIGTKNGTEIGITDNIIENKNEVNYFDCFSYNESLYSYDFKVIPNEYTETPLSSLIDYMGPKAYYNLNMHIYRIFTDEETAKLKAAGFNIKTNEAYSVNLTDQGRGNTFLPIHNDYENTDNTEYGRGSWSSLESYSNGKYDILDITADNLKLVRPDGLYENMIYSTPPTSTISESNRFDVSYKYKSDGSIQGKTKAAVTLTGSTATLTLKSETTAKSENYNDIITLTREVSGSTVVIKNGTTALTDQTLSDILKQYDFCLADTLRIKFFLSSATNKNLLDTDTLNKIMNEDKPSYLINTTYKYKIVYQYKNKLTGYKAEQAYTIVVDSNN